MGAPPPTYGLGGPTPTYGLGTAGGPAPALVSQGTNGNLSVPAQQQQPGNLLQGHPQGLSQAPIPPGPQGAQRLASQFTGVSNGASLAGTAAPSGVSAYAQQYTMLKQTVHGPTGSTLPPIRPGQPSQAQTLPGGHVATQIPFSTGSHAPPMPSQPQALASSQQGQLHMAVASTSAPPSSSGGPTSHPHHPLPAGGGGTSLLPANFSRYTSQQQPQSSSQAMASTLQGQTCSLMPQAAAGTTQYSGVPQRGGLQTALPGASAYRPTSGQPSQQPAASSGMQAVPMAPQGPLNWLPQATLSNLAPTSAPGASLAAAGTAEPSGLSGTVQNRGGPFWATSGMPQAVASYKPGAQDVATASVMGASIKANPSVSGMPTSQGPGASSGTGTVTSAHVDQGQQSTSWQAPAAACGSGQRNNVQGVSGLATGIRPPNTNSTQTGDAT